MKRSLTNPPLCGLRIALCGLCPLALPPASRTPACGRQVAQLVHDEPLPKTKRRFHPAKIALPLGPRLRRKTRPNPGGSKRRGSLGGGKEGGLVSNPGPCKLPQKCTESRRGPVPASPVAMRWRDRVQVAAPPARALGDGPRPKVSAPQGVGSDTCGTSAGAAAQISAGPASHHRLLRQGQLSRPARAAVREQSRSNRSGQLLSSRLRCLGSCRSPFPT
ncbi:hypothetical protein mRhiFer1_009920 [Rhinolophus ferrumequinum]|uniref:Uncharacterized protein n=1 Tax=Rhinolophus ferrumequinum TaxID=59479 RepID=A0A7J7YIF3_RHIFE|nr:hypothetical protein mRhiFer1_009920 [Rhinolophus ferrumequinum]